jgi:hypothetical protein
VTPIDYVTSRNWREATDQFRSARYFYASDLDRSDLPHCEGNEKPPGVLLWCYPPLPIDCAAPTFEAEVCGEVGGVWLKFCAYGLRSLDEVKTGIEHVREAWRSRATKGAKP